MQSIQIDKDTVLRAYCLYGEAHRSVHRSLDAQWVDFQDYYRGEKTAALTRLVGRLSELAGPGDVPARPITRVEAGESVSSPGFFRYYFGTWIARRKSSWSFPEVSVRFMTSTLMTLLAWLELPTKPDLDGLIALRMDFCNCLGIIDARCHGLPELERARLMEHFHQTEWLPTVTMAQVLGEQCPRNERARRIA
jgi:hypothetical protein